MNQAMTRNRFVCSSIKIIFVLILRMRVKESKSYLMISTRLYNKFLKFSFVYDLNLVFLGSLLTLV